MQIQLERPQSENLVRHLESVDDGFRVTIGGKTYNESLIITPLTLELWGVDAVAAITERHLQGLLGLNLEVVLIGTGRFLEFPPPRVYRSVVDRGIGVEIMDTPAACRTYNILAGDGRKVAAALIL